MAMLQKNSVLFQEVTVQYACKICLSCCFCGFRFIDVQKISFEQESFIMKVLRENSVLKYLPKILIYPRVYADSETVKQSVSSTKKGKTIKNIYPELTVFVRYLIKTNMGDPFRSNYQSRFEQHNSEV